MDESAAGCVGQSVGGWVGQSVGWLVSQWMGGWVSQLVSRWLIQNFPLRELKVSLCLFELREFNTEL